MRYLSSDNIKTAAAEQPNPAREKNLLGELMPIAGGSIAGLGTHHLLEHLPAPLARGMGYTGMKEMMSKNPKTVLALMLANIAGGALTGRHVYKRLNEVPNNSLPEMFLQPT